MPIRRVGAFVQALGDRHRATRAEAQLAARLLLEGRCREGWRRAALLGPSGEAPDDRRELPEGIRMAAGGRLVADLDGCAVDPGELGLEAVAGRGREGDPDRPVL